MKSVDEQMTILMQGVDFGDEQIRQTMAAELRQRLAEGRPLRVYCGYDPTAADLHLGHTVTMNKLRQFQELGHEVTFLIGTFTGLIGDPSDKDSARKQQTPQQVQEKAKTYADQVLRILDRAKTAVRYNGDWLSQLSFGDVIGLAAHFTVQQFLSQERFAKRQARGDPIWLHEFLYALMQGYDAVQMQADVQVGGVEQLFNLMAGRKLQEVRGLRPQVVLTLPILVGTDGHQRMSKTTGNYIGISEPPETMYGKVMSIPDEAMLNFFTLITRLTPDELAALERGLTDGTLHPMEAKKKLAWEIVSRLYDEQAAAQAAAHFERVHQQGELPDEIPVHLSAGPASIVDLLLAAGLVSSKSEARRIIEQGGVKLDGEMVGEIGYIVEQDAVLQVGKRKFVKIVTRAIGQSSLSG